MPSLAISSGAIQTASHELRMLLIYSTGDKMLPAVHTVLQMAAIRFGLPAGAYIARMNNGPHLIVPTDESVCSLTMQAAVSSNRKQDCGACAVGTVHWQHARCSGSC